MGNSMIQVAGRPLTADGIAEFGAEERIIIQQMLNAPETFSYRTMNELRFELNMRKNIMDSAREMSDSKAAFTIFETARCNPAYWNLTNAGGFLLRPGVRPSEAVLDIYRNGSLYAFECATAMVIVYYHAVLKSIGSPNFDILFQNLYLYSWHTDPDLELHPTYLDYFLPGDVVYFNNPEFHPNVSWFRGLNAVVLSDGTYFGHGFGIMTADQIINFLNTQRFPGSTQPAYLANIVTRISSPTMHKLFTLQGSRIAPKKTKVVVHHNLCSISRVQYEYYCKQVNGSSI